MTRAVNNGISVIICCYNSAQRLPETLKHLALQIVPPEIMWEIIVIDNASTDDTAIVAEHEWEKYKLPNFRVLHQPKLGKNYAYKQGIYEANYEYVLTCDDDNWLFSNYIATAFNLMNADNYIGVLGGCGIFEPQEPAWNEIEKYKLYYVNGTQAKHATEHWVYGAGSVCRRKVLKYLFDINWQQVTSGRKGSSLICGEDVEMCFMFYLLGYKIVADDRLLFRHFVPIKRQNESYIIRMSFWQTYSNVLLNGYYSIMNKTDITNINKWYIAAAKTLIKHHLLLFYRKTLNFKALSTDEKIGLKASQGTFVSLFKNRKKIIAHYHQLLALLTDNHLTTKQS